MIVERDIGSLDEPLANEEIDAFVTGIPDPVSMKRVDGPMNGAYEVDAEFWHVCVNAKYRFSQVERAVGSFPHRAVGAHCT